MQGQAFDIELSDSDGNAVEYDPPLVPVEDEPGSAEGSSGEEDEPQASTPATKKRLCEKPVRGEIYLLSRYIIRE